MTPSLQSGAPLCVERRLWRLKVALVLWSGSACSGGPVPFRGDHQSGDDGTISSSGAVGFSTSHTYDDMEVPVIDVVEAEVLESGDARSTEYQWSFGAPVRLDLPVIDQERHVLRLVMDADEATAEANDQNRFQVRPSDEYRYCIKY